MLYLNPKNKEKNLSEIGQINCYRWAFLNKK
jgi:hypothetical protein